MSTDRDSDAQTRQRLVALVARLGDDELMTQMADGWTVAATLAHLAFWDRRAALLIERWQRDGVGASAADVDAVNDAAKAQWLALPPRVAAEQAVEAAQAADAALEASSRELVQQIVDIGYPINIRRGIHRGQHLDEIERSLR
jgi:uncharacterized damage-inducible protein DinB